jgi:thiol:disulfide interchange protein
MPPKKHRKPSRLPQYLALGGFIVLVFVVLALKDKPQQAISSPGEAPLPEAQLAAALAEKRPVLAFIHSDTCVQCSMMMDTVAQVFPGFKESITLVDIDVYDPLNEPLLRRLRVRFIPTLIFYDQAGQSEMNVGVMEAEQLNQVLTALAGGS